MSLLKLARFNQPRNALAVLRDLTPEEESKHASFVRIFAEARNRLSLFKMLSKNYDQWSSFVSSLLTAEIRDHDDTQIELNRLLLNYLTFAYTIREHFEVSYRQRHKKNEKKLKEYDEFIDRFCDKCWAFAFISDFRGYVQHRGLAVGQYKRNIGRTAVKIEILADAGQLLRESREWKKSKLAPERGEIDLVDLLFEFHLQMVQTYGPFMAKAFFPELMPASKFYGELTIEAKSADPEAIMVFQQGEPATDMKNGRLTMNLNVIMPPNDVFGELGIQVKQAEPDQPVTTTASSGPSA